MKADLVINLVVKGGNKYNESSRNSQDYLRKDFLKNMIRNLCSVLDYR